MDNTEITLRFFSALDRLKADKVIHGVSNFTARHGIDNRNLYQLRQDPSRGIFKAWWLSVLVTDYGISPEWLLIGKGDMYQTKKAKSNSLKSR